MGQGPTIIKGFFFFLLIKNFLFIFFLFSFFLQKIFFDSLSFSMLFLTFVVFPALLNSFYKFFTRNIKNVTLLIIIIIFCFFFTNSIFFMFLFFEAVLLPIILIVIGWGYQFERLQASRYLLLYTIFFSFPLFIVLIYLFKATKNTFFLTYSFLFFSSLRFCLFLPFFVKLPIIFVHFWLPKAHVEAPTIGSIVLASLLLKLGGFGVIRFLDLLFIKMELFLVVSIYGMLIATLVCVFQSDTKRLVAYLSVAHINFMLCCLLTHFMSSKGASILIIVAHGFSSGIIFFCVGFVYYFILNRSLYFNHLSFVFFPFMVLSITMRMLANFGVPPFLRVLPEVYFFSIIYRFNKNFVFVLLLYCIYMVYISLFFLLNFFHGSFFRKKFFVKNSLLFGGTNFFLTQLLLNWKILLFVY